MPSHSTAKANDEELTYQHAILDAIEIGECYIHSTAKANDGVQMKEVHITNDEELTSQHAILDAIEIGECYITC